MSSYCHNGVDSDQIQGLTLVTASDPGVKPARYLTKKLHENWREGVHWHAWHAAFADHPVMITFMPFPSARSRMMSTQERITACAPTSHYNTHYTNVLPCPPVQRWGRHVPALSLAITTLCSNVDCGRERNELDVTFVHAFGWSLHPQAHIARAC